MKPSLLAETSYYQKLFQKYHVDPCKLKTPEDWHEQGLPLITKKEYLKNWKEFIVNPKKPVITYWKATHRIPTPSRVKKYFTPHRLFFSSGTETGMPAPVMITKPQVENLRNTMNKIARQLIKENYNSERTIGMNLFPYGPHLAWHAVHFAMDNADINLCTAAGGAMRTAQLVKLAGTAKPNIIAGMAYYIKNVFLPEAIKQKIKLPEKMLFINGGQKIYSPEIEEIKKLAAKTGAKKTKVLDIYGASEMKEDLLVQLHEKKEYTQIAKANHIRTVSTGKTKNGLIEEWNFEEQGYCAIWGNNGAGTLFAGYLIGDIYEGISQKPLTIQNIDRIRNKEAQLQMTGIIEQKIKGARVNLSALREQTLKILGVKEAQIIAHPNKITIKAITTKPELLKKEMQTHEYRPEVKIVKEFPQDKIKFEDIICKSQ